MTLDIGEVDPKTAVPGDFGNFSTETAAACAGGGLEAVECLGNDVGIQPIRVLRSEGAHGDIEFVARCPPQRAGYSFGLLSAEGRFATVATESGVSTVVFVEAAAELEAEGVAEQRAADVRSRFVISVVAKRN